MIATGGCEGGLGGPARVPAIGLGQASRHRLSFWLAQRFIACSAWQVCHGNLQPSSAKAWGGVCCWEPQGSGGAPAAPTPLPLWSGWR